MKSSENVIWELEDVVFRGPNDKILKYLAQKSTEKGIQIAEKFNYYTISVLPKTTIFLGMLTISWRFQFESKILFSGCKHRFLEFMVVKCCAICCCQINEAVSNWINYYIFLMHSFEKNECFLCKFTGINTIKSWICILSFLTLNGNKKCRLYKEIPFYVK